MPRPALSLLALLATFPASAAAQFAPLTVPRGRYALELQTTFANWDRRFRDGTLEPAGADFTRANLDAGYLPALQGAEETLARITGATAPVLRLGGISTIALNSEREAALGLRIGVTSRLTVQGLVPIRRVRVQSVTTFDGTGATAGFNPTDPVFGSPAGAGATLLFFSQFDTALQALASRLASGAYDGDPATRALAMATLAEATALHDDLYAVMVEPASRSAFLPTTGSQAGLSLAARIGGLQDRFANALGIAGFTGQPALAAQALTAEGFEDFLTNPEGPVAGALETPPVTALGDIEFGAAYLLLDRPSASPWGTSLRLATSATVRLRTSQLANPSHFLALGTGERQPDLEVALVLDAARGRGALRLAGWYNRQYAGNQLRRIGPPDQPIQYANRAAALRRDPGDFLGASVLPAYRFTPGFALVGGVEWWRRGTDRYDYVEGQAPIEGVDPNLLAEESAATALSLRGGLLWSHPGTGGGTPLDALVTWERVVSATGGRVPEREVIRAMLRIYGRWR